MKINKIIISAALTSILTGCFFQKDETPRVQFCESQTLKENGIKVYLDEKDSDKINTLILENTITKEIIDAELKAEKKELNKENRQTKYKELKKRLHNDYKALKSGKYKTKYISVDFMAADGIYKYKNYYIFDLSSKNVKKFSQDTNTNIGFLLDNYRISFAYDQEKEYFSFERLQRTGAWNRLKPLKCKAYDEKALQKKIKEKEKEEKTSQKDSDNAK